MSCCCLSYSAWMDVMISWCFTKEKEMKYSKIWLQWIYQEIARWTPYTFAYTIPQYQRPKIAISSLFPLAKVKRPVDHAPRVDYHVMLFFVAWIPHQPSTSAADFVHFNKLHLSLAVYTWFYGMHATTVLGIVLGWHCVFEYVKKQKWHRGVHSKTEAVN